MFLFYVEWAIFPALSLGSSRCPSKRQLWCHSRPFPWSLFDPLNWLWLPLSELPCCTGHHSLIAVITLYCKDLPPSLNSSAFQDWHIALIYLMAVEWMSGLSPFSLNHLFASAPPFLLSLSAFYDCLWLISYKTTSWSDHQYCSQVLKMMTLAHIYWALTLWHCFKYFTGINFFKCSSVTKLFHERLTLTLWRCSVLL